MQIDMSMVEFFREAAAIQRIRLATDRPREYRITVDGRVLAVMLTREQVREVAATATRIEAVR